jgi:phosphoglycerate dehydrogenase-like enzyme
MLKGLYILGADTFDKVYVPEVRQEIDKYVHIYAPSQTKESIRNNLSLLKDADVIFSGWGGATMDEPFLQAAPNLKAVFYGAGSIKKLVTDAFWERNIPITSAYAANAIPVTEYTLSQILFLLKGGWFFAQSYKKQGKATGKGQIMSKLGGGYRSTVGIISLGIIGRRVCELLRNFDLKVIAYDPYFPREEAARLNIELCSLDELFRQSDVVSLHTPWLKETEGLITGEHFASMKPWASFINTSRGAIIREQEMIKVLQERPDLHVVLDVTYPEPPEPDSPLYVLPNVTLTPHIAGGATPGECRRLGEFMLEELKRYCHREPLLWEITRAKAAIMA